MARTYREAAIVRVLIRDDLGNSGKWMAEVRPANGSQYYVGEPFDSYEAMAEGLPALLKQALARR